MKEMFVFYIYKNLAGIVYISTMLLLIVISYFVGNGQAHYIWKRNLKYHLPEVLKDEISEKDEYIHELETENNRLKERLEKVMPYIISIKWLDI